MTTELRELLEEAIRLLASDPQGGGHYIVGSKLKWEQQRKAFLAKAYYLLLTN